MTVDVVKLKSNLENIFGGKVTADVRTYLEGVLSFKEVGRYANVNKLISAVEASEDIDTAMSCRHMLESLVKVHQALVTGRINVTMSVMYGLTIADMVGSVESMIERDFVVKSRLYTLGML